MHRCNVVSIAAACSRCQAVLIDLSDSGVGGWDPFCFEHSKELTSCVRFQVVNTLSVQLAI